MNLERAQYYNENMDRLMQTDRLFLNNPVFIGGLGLAPIVVAATSLSNAGILAVGVFLLLTPVRVLSALVCGKVPPHLRLMVYAIVSGIWYIPVYLFMRSIFGIGLEAVGLYLPLLVVEPIVLKRAERAKPEAVGMALRKGLTTTAGFLLALFVIAALREWLGMGTLLGIKIGSGAPLPLAGITAGGFLLAGLLAAFWRWARGLFKKYVSLEAKQEL